MSDSMARLQSVIPMGLISLCQQGNCADCRCNLTLDSEKIQVQTTPSKTKTSGSDDPRPENDYEDSTTATSLATCSVERQFQSENIKCQEVNHKHGHDYIGNGSLNLRPTHFSVCRPSLGSNKLTMYTSTTTNLSLRSAMPCTPCPTPCRPTKSPQEQKTESTDLILRDHAKDGKEKLSSGLPIDYLCCATAKYIKLLEGFLSGMDQTADVNLSQSLGSMNKSGHTYNKWARSSVVPTPLQPRQLTSVLFPQMQEQVLRSVLTADCSQEVKHTIGLQQERARLLESARHMHDIHHQESSSTSNETTGEQDTIDDATYLLTSSSGLNQNNAPIALSGTCTLKKDTNDEASDNHTCASPSAHLHDHTYSCVMNENDLSAPFSPQSLNRKSDKTSTAVRGMTPSGVRAVDSGFESSGNNPAQPSYSKFTQQMETNSLEGDFPLLHSLLQERKGGVSIGEECNKCRHVSCVASMLDDSSVSTSPCSSPDLIDDDLIIRTPPSGSTFRFTPDMVLASSTPALPTVLMSSYDRSSDMAEGPSTIEQIQDDLKYMTNFESQYSWQQKSAGE